MFVRLAENPIRALNPHRPAIERQLHLEKAQTYDQKKIKFSFWDSSSLNVITAKLSEAEFSTEISVDLASKSLSIEF